MKKKNKKIIRNYGDFLKYFYPNYKEKSIKCGPTIFLPRNIWVVS